MKCNHPSDAIVECDFALTVKWCSNCGSIAHDMGSANPEWISPKEVVFKSDFQKLWDDTQEEANDLALSLARGHNYHGSNKVSKDWHIGWETCAKNTSNYLFQILNKHNLNNEE